MSPHFALVFLRVGESEDVLDPIALAVGRHDGDTATAQNPAVVQPLHRDGKDGPCQEERGQPSPPHDRLAWLSRHAQSDDAGY